MLPLTGIPGLIYPTPKKCHCSPAPSSIKGTDSPHKEASYQISARETKAAQRLSGKAFMRACAQGSCGAPGR